MHRRPNGDLMEGYFCSRCGEGGVNMLASGHGHGLCEPNPTLVAELRAANAEVETPTAVACVDAPDDPYLVWSNEHRRWWGPGQCGYFDRVSQAGRYSREQALAICRQALGTAGHMGIFAELPVLLRDVEDFVRGQMIPGRLM
jgi:ribosomal protein S27AE